MKIQKIILDEISRQLEGKEPSDIDKSIMIKLTPLEILNLVKMGAKYWSNSIKQNTTKSMKEVCSFHTEVAIGILAHSDPDRFEYKN